MKCRLLACVEVGYMQFALVFCERFHYTLFARLLLMLTRIDHSLALLSLTGLRLKFQNVSKFVDHLKFKYRKKYEG